jgi:diguanylate cyclase (GGDEF)-like protein
MARSAAWPRCCPRRGSPVGVVLPDIDHFTSINDRHGHPGGDDALRRVARLLSDRVRSRADE